MQHPARPSRLFVALDPPPAARRVLGRVAAALARDTGGRAVPDADLHLTLRFLGPVPADRLPALSDALAGCAAGTAALPCAAGPVECLPRRGRPRLAAVRIVERDPAGPLADLWRRVRAACIAATGMGDGEDAFWPHVTVVRYRPPAARRPEPGGGGEHPFDFDRMSLYDSRTGHGGPPSYVPVAVFPLGGNPTST